MSDAPSDDALPDQPYARFVGMVREWLARHPDHFDEAYFSAGPESVSLILIDPPRERWPKEPMGIATKALTDEVTQSTACGRFVVFDVWYANRPALSADAFPVGDPDAAEKIADLVKDAAELRRERDALRAICLRVIEADDSGDEAALMDLGVIADEIREMNLI